MDQLDAFWLALQMPPNTIKTRYECGKKWEVAIQSKKVNPEEDLKNKYVNVQQHEFIKGRFLGLGCFASFMGWIVALKGLVLTLIHILLFQNSFELAVFFWILVQYGFYSCIMGKVGFIIPRLIIGVFVQFLCSFSTLPLYAIVTQMGTSFNKAIFEKDVQQGLVGWAQKAKVKGFRKAANGSSQVGQAKNLSPGAEILLANAEQMEEGNGSKIVPDNGHK